MTVIAWITDPHLNFLRNSNGARAFGEYTAQDLAAYEAEDPAASRCVVITGDIAECSNLHSLLSAFVAGVNTSEKYPVYFVLGNHDLYGGSQARAHYIARLVTETTNSKWLTESGVIELTPDTALVGNDGWYDARNGDPNHLQMTDFSAIDDLTARDRDGGRKRLPRHALILAAQRLADKCVEDSRKVLRRAASKYANVIFATHVPPFARAAWHAGSVSDGDWLPWMSCKAMGEMLIDLAEEFPENNFTVLCGHTHGEGVYTPVPNVTVLTGAATYGHPAIHKILEV